MLFLAIFVLCAMLFRPTSTAKSGSAISDIDIYVDPTTGTENESCWSDGMQLPCRTLDLALLGATRVVAGTVTVHLQQGEHNITTEHSFVKRHGFGLVAWTPGGDRSVGRIYDRSVQTSGQQDTNAIGATITCLAGAQAGLSFYNSSGIILENIKFIGCGVIHNSTTVHDKFLKFQVALYLLFCSDVSMENLTIADSNGTGLVLYGTVGQNKFIGCNFMGNTQNYVLPDGSDGGGGGVSVEFLYCVPGNDACFKDANFVPSSDYASDSTYLFESCYFSNNVAKPDNHFGDMFVFPTKNYSVSLGRGGGLQLFFKGMANNISITITDCHFMNNTAAWGAGIEMIFQDSAMSNTVRVHSSTFVDNKCDYDVFSYQVTSTGGGGARIHYSGVSRAVRDNKVVMLDTVFYNNSAYIGGGISFLTYREAGVHHATNTIVFTNCSWTSNTARLGSAVDLALWHEITEGTASKPQLINCSIVGNSVDYTNLFGAPLGFGTIYSDSIDICFKGTLDVVGNFGSGIVSLDAGLEFDLENNTANFFNNSGNNGGALALLGYAYIIVYQNVTLLFINNSAQFTGGAIYWESSGEHELVSSRSCFIRYIDIIHPELWNAKFIFNQNTAALDGNAIYASTLLTCIWGNLPHGTLNNVVEAYDKVFCWNNHSLIWDYGEDTCSSSIATAGSSFANVTHGQPYNMTTIPGELKRLPVVINNDRNTSIPQHSQFFSMIIKGQPTYTSSLQQEILPDSSSKNELRVKIGTLQPCVLTTEVVVKFSECPPGYRLNSTSMNDEKFCHNCMKCEFAHFPYIETDGTLKSKIQRGNWIGYDNTSSFNETKMLSGSCFYCASDPSVNGNEYISLPVDPAQLDEKLCRPLNRSGLLCSDCIDGFAPSVNSKFYQCVNCSDDMERYSWAFYILTEFTPITIMLIIVILFNVSVTSGPGNAFVFFAQIITGTFGVDAEGHINYHVVSSAEVPIKHVYYALYDIWNLNFFDSIPGCQYCLSRHINSLQVRTLDYLTAAYPLIVLAIILLITILHEREVKIIVWMIKPFHRLFARFRRRWSFQRSIMDAFGTFLVLSFSKFAITSTYMLFPSPLFDHAGDVAKHVSYVHAEYQYFSISYAPYLAVAILVFSLICLLMPLILFFYSIPPFYNCLNRLKLGFLLPGPKFQMFLNVFHNCFKDGTNGTQDLRFFASVYFLLRVLMVSANFLGQTWPLQYLMQQISCTIAILLFGAFQPYKNRFYNFLDEAIFSLLAIINVISLYNRYIVSVDRPPSTALYWLQVILIFVPLMYMSCYVIGYSFKTNKDILKLFFLRICCCGKRATLGILKSGHSQSFNSFMDTMVANGEWRDTINYHGPAPVPDPDDSAVRGNDRFHTSVHLLDESMNSDDTEPLHWQSIASPNSTTGTNYGSVLQSQSLQELT